MILIKRAFVPVFNAGKLIANKKLAKTNREIAMLDFVNTLLNAYKEVESGFESDLTSNQALEIINQNIILKILKRDEIIEKQ